MVIDGVSRGGGERRAARSFEAVQPGLAAVPSREPAAPWRISVGGQDADLGLVIARRPGPGGQAGGARGCSPGGGGRGAAAGRRRAGGTGGGGLAGPRNCVAWPGEPVGDLTVVVVVGAAG